MVAPVLHLHISPRAAFEPLDQMPRCLGHAHNIIDAHLLGPAQQARRRPCFRLHLFMIADHTRHFGLSDRDGGGV